MDLIATRCRWLPCALLVLAFGASAGCAAERAATYRFVDSVSGAPIGGDFAPGDPGSFRRGLFLTPRDDGALEVRWIGCGDLPWAVGAPGYEWRAIDLEPGTHVVALTRRPGEPVVPAPDDTDDGTDS